MRTITIPKKIIPEHTVTLYEFNELPKEVKEELLQKHKDKQLNVTNKTNCMETETECSTVRPTQPPKVLALLLKCVAQSFPFPFFRIKNHDKPAVSRARPKAALILLPARPCRDFARGQEKGKGEDLIYPSS